MNIPVLRLLKGPGLQSARTNDGHDYYHTYTFNHVSPPPSLLHVCKKRTLDCHASPLRHSTGPESFGSPGKICRTCKRLCLSQTRTEQSASSHTARSGQPPMGHFSGLGKAARGLRKRGRVRESRAASAVGGKAAALIDEDENIKDAMKRGNMFMEDEGLCVARRWVAQPMKGPNQREDRIWAGKHMIIKGTYSVSRSEASCGMFWRRLAFQSMYYIFSVAFVESCLRSKSGKNMDGLDKYTMISYKRFAGG